MPEHPEALVRLWNHWDQTGGWGMYEFVDAQGDTIDARDRQWYLTVRNSFLRPERTEKGRPGPEYAAKVRRLGRFWCGYIQGFLSRALPAVDRLKRDLSKEDLAKVRMPTKTRVHGVEHLGGKRHGKSTTDTFVITFEGDVWYRAAGSREQRMDESKRREVAGMHRGFGGRALGRKEQGY